MKTREKKPKKQKARGQHEAAGRSKVFIVEDHPVFREGIAHLIEAEEDLQLCGTAGDAFAARRDITRLKPDLALIDISLPGKSGLELIKELRAAHKALKLLAVSMHDEAIYANRVLRLGGDGYIMKKEDPSEIIHAIRDVLSGHIYLSENVLSSPAAPADAPPEPAPARLLDRLTDAELEILELLGQGKTTEEIAQQLSSTSGSIEGACEEMRKKLNLKSENALIRYAVCWVETDRT